MDAGWMPDGCRMDAGWMPDGCRMDAGWMPDGCRMDAGWMPDGCRMDAGWMPDGCRMDAKKDDKSALRFRHPFLNCIFQLKVKSSAYARQAKAGITRRDVSMSDLPIYKPDGQLLKRKLQKDHPRILAYLNSNRNNPRCSKVFSACTVSNQSVVGHKKVFPCWNSCFRFIRHDRRLQQGISCLYGL